jgi:hypothetical protein
LNPFWSRTFTIDAAAVHRLRITVDGFGDSVARALGVRVDADECASDMSDKGACAHRRCLTTRTDEYSHVHFESCSTSLRASFSRNYTHELRLLHHMRPTDATCSTHLDIFVHPRTCRQYTIHMHARPFAAIYATLQVNTFGARAVHVVTATVLVGVFVALCATGMRAALVTTMLVALLTWWGVGGVTEMKRCVINCIPITPDLQSRRTHHHDTHVVRHLPHCHWCTAHHTWCAAGCLRSVSVCACGH